MEGGVLGLLAYRMMIRVGHVYTRWQTAAV